jgi:tRNA(adenine34) deaminase
MENSPDDLAYLKKALELAEEAASHDEVPVGAIVVLQGKVIGLGRNQREEKKCALSHAEVEAIRMATEAVGDWRLEQCTLYVTLEPCPMCLAACQQARIERVVFGALDPKGGALSLGYNLHEDSRTHHRFRVEHLAHSECSTILKNFFAAKRAKKSEV